jgi:GGDEF domain-containing protein
MAALRSTPVQAAGAMIPPLSFSAGIAAVDAGMSQEQVIERADRRVYGAKTAGRGRVVATDNDESPHPH